MVTYREAGVDIRAGDEAVDRIARHVRSTWTPRVLDYSHGGFAGLFQLDYPKGILRREYKNPVLVGCTDGVGTKLEVAFRMGVADTIGRDLVAMCVNDLVVQGAEPLFFLDYVAVGKLDPEQIEMILKGIAAGCREAGCAILGGETAEMPGFYRPGQYELAGFALGVVEKSRLILGHRVQVGDDVLGLASSGIHSNGYSLVRKIFLGNRRWHLNERVEGLRRPLGVELLEPTRIYVRPVLDVLQRYKKKQVVHALAHITGSGLPGNIPRVIPRNMDVVLWKGDWPIPPVFRLIQEAGKVGDGEMFDVFNMGIGLVMVVSPAYTDSILKQLAELKCPAWQIGKVVKGKNRVLLR
jgi:phosphoribosylformylglycinamidine cyclo-ligase